VSAYLEKVLEKDPREDRLPKWAQKKLDDLRFQVKSADHRAGPSHPGHQPRRGAGRHRSLRLPRGLKDVRVTFKPRKDADYLECIDVVAIPGGIEIHGRSGPIFVYPASSNVVRVKMGGDW